MNRCTDMNQDEILMRNHKALLYSTKAEFRRMHAERKMDRLVKRIFIGSLVFFLWVLTLSLLVGAL